MYSESLTEFHGQPVVDYRSSDDWQGSQITYRLRLDYDDDMSIGDLLESLAGEPGHEQLTGLIIGAWAGSCEGEGSAQTVEDLTEAAHHFPALQHLFLGEMTVEECEISWIVQTDVSPVLNALPQLESLRIRGGSELSFSLVRHNNLKELAIETGGLGRSVLREIFSCEFPQLERLELLLGDASYGFDGGVEDLQPLLAGRLFPKLTWLGLMNSEIANDIAAVVVNSPIVERLKVLDLSMGNLDDEGARSLMGLSAFPNLETLNISHHYVSESTLDDLAKAIPCKLIADDRQEPDDDWRPILHAE